MTDEEFTAWLKDQSALRCVLVEAEYSYESRGSFYDDSIYFSTKGYTTSPTDTPPNLNYPARIKGGVKFTEKISLTGNAGLQFGDIEIDNSDGYYDYLFKYAWTNQNILIVIGDVGWPRADFRTIFNGTIANIASRNRNSINIKLRDKLQRLNTPMTDVKLGGSSSNADRLIPLTFGECFNVRPLLIDVATHKYQFHNSSSESVIEVRDNGVPVNKSSDLPNGTFTLFAQPAGEITASVQGDNDTAYENTIAKVIERIVTGYGLASTRFTAGDLDAANLAQFDIDNPQPIGIYSSQRLTVVRAIQQLASSIGAQVVMSREGLLQLIQINSNFNSPVMLINDQKIKEHSMKVSSLPEMSAAIKIGYCKNYTVQQNLQTGIPEDHKDLFYDEWLTFTKTNSSVASGYMLTDEPIQKDTNLITANDAESEATRLLDLKSSKLIIYQFVGFAEMFDLRLGDTVTLDNRRFQLDQEDGMVVELSPDWMTNMITVSVLCVFQSAQS